MKKRILGLLLTAALVLGVTGCGNTTEKKSSEQAQGSREELKTEAGETQTVKNDIWWKMKSVVMESMTGMS